MSNQGQEQAAFTIICSQDFQSSQSTHLPPQYIWQVVVHLEGFL